MRPYYQDEAVTIYHGDCREVLPTLEKADLVLTDPPYGLGSWTSTGGNSLRPEEVDVVNNWDANRVDPALLRLAVGCGKWWVCWGANYFADVLGASRTPLIWDKAQPAGMHFADGEMAFTNFKHGSLSIFRQPFYATDYKGSRQHPTQRPVALMQWCIEKSKTTGTILDPFMGSGTTLRAAKDLGRRAIGIEINEQYAEIAAKRMAQEVLAL